MIADANSQKSFAPRGLAGAGRDVFQEVGGFDESLPDAFADIGLCLKVWRAGYLIVYTLFAKLYKHEPRADKIDMGSEAIMRERWSDVVRPDPYYNANLSRERADFSLGNKRF
jgi:GT2 family glycosyltransferase